MMVVVMMVVMMMVVVLGANKAAAVEELTAHGFSQKVPRAWQAGGLLRSLDHLRRANVRLLLLRLRPFRPCRR